MAGTKIGSLNELLASRARASFRYRVDFDSRVDVNEINAWCEKNCRGLWRKNYTYAVYYQFEDDYDATMFMLRWGGTSGTELT